MNARYGYVMLLLAAGIWSGCSEENKDASEKEGVATVLPAQVAEVSVMTLKKQAFEHELVSNGKVEAKRYAALQFRTTTEPVARIYVKNGDRVKKGQKIAELDLVCPAKQTDTGGIYVGASPAGNAGCADRARICSRPDGSRA